MVVRGPSDGAQLSRTSSSRVLFARRSDGSGRRRANAGPTTNRLVAVGDRVRSDLLAAGIGRPNKFVVVPPGTRLGALPSRSAARIGLGLRADSVVVTLVARLTPIKRPERFVQLAGALAGAHPDVEFVVAGGGELLQPLQDLATRLRVPVRFLGWRSDVETVYSASDVVVLTSDNEGMPVSLIEAAARGSTLCHYGCGRRQRGGGIRDDRNRHRRPTSTRSPPPSLSSSMTRSYDRRWVLRLSRAQRLFGAERLANDTADIYEELAGRSSVLAAS